MQIVSFLGFVEIKFSNFFCIIKLLFNISPKLNTLSPKHLNISKSWNNWLTILIVYLTTGVLSDIMELSITNLCILIRIPKAFEIYNGLNRKSILLFSLLYYQLNSIIYYIKQIYKLYSDFSPNIIIDKIHQFKH